jgi:hypothetical protein
MTTNATVGAVKDVDNVGLSKIESAARGCGVYAGRYSAGSLRAVRIVVDEASYFLWPEPETGGWLAAPTALSGDYPEPDRDFTLALRCTGGESSVPTYAWARFLVGDPLESHPASLLW